VVAVVVVIIVVVTFVAFKVQKKGSKFIAEMGKSYFRSFQQCKYLLHPALC
jgi:hypothetical protein